MVIDCWQSQNNGIYLLMNQDLLLVLITVDLCHKDSISMGGGGEPERRDGSKSAPANLLTVLLLWHKVDTPFLLSCLLPSLLLESPLSYPSFLHTQTPQSRKTLALSSRFLQGEKARGLTLSTVIFLFLGLLLRVLCLVLPCWDACILCPRSSHGSQRCGLPLRPSSRASSDIFHESWS